jgi:hypothetical protein
MVVLVDSIHTAGLLGFLGTRKRDFEEISRISGQLAQELIFVSDHDWPSESVIM